MMTPEQRGRIAAIRQELSLPETTDQRSRELCAQAVALVREARGKVAPVLEAKRPAKRQDKKSGDDLLDEFLSNGANDE